MITGTSEAPGVAPGGGPDAVPPARSLLERAAPLGRRQRLAHRLILAGILAFGLLKGGYWALTTQVWNPVDEIQHFGYVQSIATGEGVPTVGRDLLSDELMASLKESTTAPYRNEDYQPNHDDERWASSRHQYEAVHGPIYYALMAGPYWIGRPWGLTGSLLAVRLATVLVALAAVPLTWLLARQLFPRRPVAWLLAPALLVTVSGLSFGSVTNDALVLTLGAAATVAVLRALDRPSPWWCAGSGLLLGLTLVTKTSSAGLVPFLGLAVLAWLVVARPGWRSVATWLGWFAVGGLVTVVPWLAWNEITYHAVSASKAVDALTGSVQAPTDLTWAGIERHSDGARLGLWVTQLAVDGPYRVLWERMLVGAALIGLVAAAVRRSWRELVALLWCATALLLGFAAMEVLIFVFFGGSGGPSGRYYYGALPPAMVMIAAAAVLALGRHWGAVAITALITWSLVLERQLVDDIVTRTYLTTVIDDRLAPVVSQTWADERSNTGPVEADAGCPVEVVDLGIVAPAPPTITVTDAAGSQTARLDEDPARPSSFLSRYVLDRPATGPFTATVPESAGGGRSALFTAVDDRSPAVRLTGRTGDPVIRLYCAVDDPRSVGFDELFRTRHLDLGFGEVRAVPRVLVGLSGAATLATVAWAAAASVGSVRRRRGTPATGTVSPS